MKAFVVRGRDSRNNLIEDYIKARDAQQAREIFECKYSGMKIQSVLLEKYSY